HAGVAQKPHDALAREHDVIRHDYPHGITARSVLRPPANEPPSAPIRSPTWTSGAVRGSPASTAVTTRAGPSPTAARPIQGARLVAASSIASAAATYAAVSIAAS